MADDILLGEVDLRKLMSAVFVMIIENAKLKVRLETSQNELETVQKCLQTKNKEYSQLKQTLDARRELEQTPSRSETEREIAQLTADLADFRARSEELEENLAKRNATLQSRNSQLQTEKSDLSRAKEKLQTQHEHALAQNGRLSLSNRELENDTNTLRAENESFKTELSQRSNNILSLENQVADLKAQRENDLNLHRTEKDDEIQQLFAQLETQREEAEMYSERLEAARTENKALRREIEQLTENQGGEKFITLQQYEKLIQDFKDRYDQRMQPLVYIKIGDKVMVKSLSQNKWVPAAIRKFRYIHDDDPECGKLPFGSFQVQYEGDLFCTKWIPYNEQLSKVIRLVRDASGKVMNKFA